MSVPVQLPVENFATGDVSGLTSGGEAKGQRNNLSATITRRFQSLMVLVIVIVTAALFWKVLDNDFLLWDDDINITSNPHLGPLTGERLQWVFTDYSYVRRYVPFGWFSWCVIYSFAGLSSFAFHAATFLFHVLNAVLVFIFLRRLPGLKDEPEETSSRRMWRSGCVAAGTLFWALHPMRVETVAWASGLLYTQALCCLLVAWLCFLKAQNNSGGWRKTAWQLASLAAYGISLLTYPIGLGAVAVFFILSLLPFLQQAGGVWTLRLGWWRTVARQTSPYFLATLLVLGATLFASTHGSSQWTPPKNLQEFSLLSRIMQVSYMLGHYVWKPWLPGNLCAVYTTLIGFDPWSPRFILQAVFVIGMTGLLVTFRRRAPFLLALWFCYLALLLPVSGPTISPHFPSDRYGYIVTLTWSVLLVALLWRICQYHRRGGLAAAVAALLVLSGVAFLSVNYLPVWKNSGTFFRYNSTQIDRPEYQASAFYRLGQWHGLRGEWPLAQAAFKEGLRLRPNDTELNTDYGIALGAAGEREAAEQQFRHALELNPRNHLAHQYLGLLAKERGDLAQYEIHREAADQLRRGQALVNKTPAH
jgi:hypothetical protein